MGLVTFFCSPSQQRGLSALENRLFSHVFCFVLKRGCWMCDDTSIHPSTITITTSRVCAVLPTLVKHCMALACPSTGDTDLLALGLQPGKLLAEVRARGSWIKEWIGHMV